MDITKLNSYVITSVNAPQINKLNAYVVTNALPTPPISANTSNMFCMF